MTALSTAFVAIRPTPESAAALKAGVESGVRSADTATVGKASGEKYATGFNASASKALTSKLKASQLDLVAAQEKLTVATAKGTATAGEMAAAQSAVIKAEQGVAATSAELSAALNSEAVAAERAKVGFLGNAAQAEKMGAAMDKAAKRTVLAAVGIAGVSIKMAADFQTSMTRLVTAAGESESNFKSVSNGVLDIAKTTGTSTTALAKGMYQIESAGFHGADGLKVLKAAAQGAKVENADLGSVSNALTTVMEDLHAPVGQVATIMSQMVSAVGHGKMTMDDLAGSIHSVLPNAAALHLSFAEVAGALSTMTAQGIGADQAAQNLNHTIVKLAAPTLGMTKSMASYGLSAADVAKQLGKKGLTGTMEELVTAITSHMGKAGTTLRGAFNESKAAAADANREFANLPPTAQKVAQAYADGSLTLGKYRTELKGMSAPQAALLAQWKSSQDGAKGFSAALKSGGQDSQTFTAALKEMLGDQTGLQVALHLTGGAADTFNANVKAIAGATAEAGGNVHDWAVVQETLNVKMAKMKENGQVLLIQLGTALIPVFDKMITKVSSIVGWFEKHSTAAKVLGGVIGGLLVTSIVRMTAAWVTANLAFIASPIGAVVTTIVLLGTALVIAYQKSETFRDVVLGVFHYVKTGAMELAIGFEKFLLIPILDVFSTIVHGAADAFGWVPGLGGKLKAARGAFDDFRKKVDATLGNIEITLKDENTKYQISQLQQKINDIKQGKVPGVTVNNAAGQARIAELQAQIDKLKQKAPPVLAALNTAGKTKVFELQTVIDGMRQHQVPYLNIDTKAGKALAAALQKQIDAIKQGKVPSLTADYTPGKTKIAQLQAIIDAMRQHKVPYLNIDTKAGAALARSLQGQIDKLKQKYPIPVNVTTRTANDTLDQLIAKIGNINSTPIRPPAGGLPNIPGLPAKRAFGGWVFGAGTAYSDSIAAKLSNGEFVVNAYAAARNGPLLEAMNTKGNANGAHVKTGSVATYSQAPRWTDPGMAAQIHSLRADLQAYASATADLAQRDVVLQAEGIQIGRVVDKAHNQGARR